MQFYYRREGNLRRDQKVILFNQESDEVQTLTNNSKVGLRLCLRDSFYHPSAGPDLNMGGDKFSTYAEPYYDYATRDSADNINQVELCWLSWLGIPVLEFETTWGDIKEAKGISINGLAGLNGDTNKRKIMEYMKQEMIKTDDFRVMFEYVFPIKKLFNFMFIQSIYNSIVGVTSWPFDTPTHGIAASFAGAMMTPWVAEPLYTMRSQKLEWEVNYLQPFGYKYICSRNVRAT